MATLAPEREGEVIADELEPLPEEDRDEPDVDTLGPAAPAPAAIREVQKAAARIRAACSATASPSSARCSARRFVREEPYEPPTRFN